MRKPPKISEDELAAFKQASKGVKPLAKDKIRLSSPFKGEQVTTGVTTNHPKAAEKIQFKECSEISLVQGDEYISFKQAGISDKTLRKLRKGKYNVEATLDLHGMTVDEAKMAIKCFLGACLQDEKRIVLIIHGKGHHSEAPILKNQLNRWLRTISTVLAFCSAAPHHGSRGAIYVLLKNSNKGNVA